MEQAERVRLTISVPKEAHEVFTRMAETTGQSVGRVMGDWLQDTLEGAQFVTQKMEEAKRAPKTVMRELQAFSRGMASAVDELVDEAREKERRGRMPAVPAPGAARVGAAQPPSSPTGGKSPGETRKAQGGFFEGRLADEFPALVQKGSKKRSQP